MGGKMFKSEHKGTSDGLADPPHQVVRSCGERPKAPGPRDRNPSGYLLRDNPWLQLQGSGASYSMSAMSR